MFKDELSGRKPYEQQIKYNSKGKMKQAQGLNGYKILYGGKQRGNATSMHAENMGSMKIQYNDEYYSRGGGYR